jgi:hypothetical protein
MVFGLASFRYFWSNIEKRVFYGSEKNNASQTISKAALGLKTPSWLGSQILGHNWCNF